MIGQVIIYWIRKPSDSGKPAFLMSEQPADKAISAERETERDNGGNLSATLLPVVYAELRRLAQSYLQHERPGHTLQATALVHEAYLRLNKSGEVNWQDKTHFFAVAATTMRRILVDYARERQADKRGNGDEKITLSETVVFPQRDVNLIALDDALERLSELDGQQSRIVELRFFAGLTIEEAARALGVSAATVKREWTIAKAWLHREISNRDDL